MYQFAAVQLAYGSRLMIVKQHLVQSRRPGSGRIVQLRCCDAAPAGTLQRDFKHLAVDMYLFEEDGQKKLKVEAHFGKRKALAAIRTACSHVEVRAGPSALHRLRDECRIQELLCKEPCSLLQHRDLLYVPA